MHFILRCPIGSNAAYKMSPSVVNMANKAPPSLTHPLLSLPPPWIGASGSLQTRAVSAGTSAEPQHQCGRPPRLPASSPLRSPMLCLPLTKDDLSKHGAGSSCCGAVRRNTLFLPFVVTKEAECVACYIIAAEAQGGDRGRELSHDSPAPPLLRTD